MSLTTRRLIFEQVKSLRDSEFLPFHDHLDADMVNHSLAAEGVTFHQCTYTPPVTLRLFLTQVIDPDHSCRAADRLPRGRASQVLLRGDQQLQ